MKPKYAANGPTGIFGLLAMLVPAVVMAQQTVEVTNAWARATAPGQKVGGIYMDIRSAMPARLVAASSPAAGRIELHNMKLENNVMKMFAVEGIDLPARQTVKLAPGGYHMMLLDLKRELKKGDRVPVALAIESRDKIRQTIEIRAEVRDMVGGHQAH